MIDLVRHNVETIKQLCQMHEVESLHLFGSACTERFSPESDIDFLITFKELSVALYKEDYFSLHQKMESLFNRKVDLITERSLNNPFFTSSVEQTKELIYSA
jgi:predicted nucleotidyltransferase